MRSWVLILFPVACGACAPDYAEPAKLGDGADTSTVSDGGDDEMGDASGGDSSGAEDGSSEGSGSGSDGGTDGGSEGSDETGGDGDDGASDGSSDDTGGPIDERKKKVLTIMVDGWRPDVISAADTPTIDSLWPDSAYSLETRVEDTTISGSGQSTFVTGVHRDKHGVDDNSFDGRQFELYPYWFRLLDEAAPHLVTGAYHTWEPMHEYALNDSEGADFAYFWDYGDEDGDARTTTQLQLDIVTEELDAIVWMLSDLDTNGHRHGFSPTVPEYVAAMELIDQQIGQVLDALESRDDYADEDWMIIISMDHAGSGYGHGDNIPEHRLGPMFIIGGSAVPGPMWPSPNTVSVVPTALAHLGVEIDPEWELDGTVVGMEATAPPLAAFETNLIVNPGADMERGFWGESPDAAIPGWVDHGQVTSIKYGSEGFLSLDSPGPESRGENFFCGGDSTGDQNIYQDIDLSSLADEIDSGAVGYALEAWLGGYSNQEDRASVLLQLYDSTGTMVYTGNLPAVTADERDDETSLVRRNRFGMIPAFVRSARVNIQFTRDEGINDGYADNLSLELTLGRFPLLLRDL